MMMQAFLKRGNLHSSLPVQGTVVTFLRVLVINKIWDLFASTLTWHPNNSQFTIICPGCIFQLCAY